ncbi:GNAT family N-acetyltransferase [Curtobacterium sp. MCLR17_032]|uniref:GNAT family N-acetyltransferase n=1 Tax=Curtobacterium sp. MCLR17_032 TaxID=2175650 RepID=UPI000DA77876|nr:GNAT family N-acetyltransferase [Curtobacterium sp. MCLR17_032]WIE61476.1 GNAT family N-acetyltransferase [Curtobacterium sp. MCLR17_032]
MISRLDLPVTVPTRSAVVVIRRATLDDLGTVLRLLTDDPISAARDGASGASGASSASGTFGREALLAHSEAFRQIAADPGNDLVVAEDADGVVVGTLQLTLIPGLSRRGSARLLVESVRVASEQRSAGVGTALMRWVTDQAAPALAVSLVQLTSDAARVDAHRFYERLGFVASHVGFKYAVERRGSDA